LDVGDAVRNCDGGNEALSRKRVYPDGGDWQAVNGVWDCHQPAENGIVRAPCDGDAAVVGYEEQARLRPGGQSDKTNKNKGAEFSRKCCKEMLASAIGTFDCWPGSFDWEGGMAPPMLTVTLGVVGHKLQYVQNAIINKTGVTCLRSLTGTGSLSPSFEISAMRLFSFCFS